MKVHEHIKLPREVTVNLTEGEVEFLLSSMARVHRSLIDTVKDKSVNLDVRKEARDFALGLEAMYSSLMYQLKLYGPKREDLN